MKQTASKRWGMYASVAVFMLLIIPVFVGAQEETGLVPCNGDDCNFSHLIALVGNVTNFLLFKISIPLATVLFLWAGFLLITAGGSEAKAAQAKGIFMNVGIGFIIALGAWLIVNVLVGVFVKTEYSGGYGIPF